MSSAQPWSLTPRARSGLAEAIDYVERRFGPATALEVLAGFESEFRRIATFPRLGHSRRDLTDDDAIRFRSLGPALLAYRETERGVEILIVERAERDWSTLVR